MKETGAEGRLRKAGEGSSAWAFVPVGGKQEWNQLSGLGLLLHQERGPGHVHKPQGPEVVGPPVPDTLPVCPQAFCCPYCSFLSPESEQVRAHALSQHAVQPTFRCPLCQEQLVGYSVTLWVTKSMTRLINTYIRIYVCVYIYIYGLLTKNIINVFPYLGDLIQENHIIVHPSF